MIDRDVQDRLVGKDQRDCLGLYLKVVFIEALVRHSSRELPERVSVGKDLNHVLDAPRRHHRVFVLGVHHAVACDGDFLGVVLHRVRLSRKGGPGEPSWGFCVAWLRMRKGSRANAPLRGSSLRN